MKKTIISLAVLGTLSGIAQAQTNVKIYGIVDTGFIKQTDADWKMGENTNNRIGFTGTEDLGSGLAATFQLERRFNLNDGTSATDLDWEGAANVGLASEKWGKVRMGRMNEISNEYIQSLDPFFQNGVGSMIWSTQRAIRIGNTIRYDSPSMKGINVSVRYSLSTKTDTGTDNDGYGVGVKYDVMPVLLQASWARQADSDNSYIWNLGASYKFGPALVSVAYEKTDNKGWLLGKALTNAGKQDTAFVALKWNVGPGTVLGLVEYSKLKNNVTVGNDDNAVMKYALGYDYKLSKTVSIYGNISYTDYDSYQLTNALKGAYKDYAKSSMAYAVGITYRF